MKFLSKCFLFVMMFGCASAFADGIRDYVLQQKLAAIEQKYGRIGVDALNTATQQHITYRASERFPMQSTFKVMGVAAFLKKSEKDAELLQQKIMYQKSDLVAWSPETEKHVTDGMTGAELCAAAIMYSDNTAINLIMKKLGGTQAVVTFARSISDNTFSLDHFEPNLNSDPRNPHDSSTPAAMSDSLQKLMLGQALAPASQKQLVSWMKDNKVGDARMRAGVPAGWSVADKTGSGGYGITNDIGVVWPPKGAPIIIAIYLVQDSKDAKSRDDVIASITRLLVSEFTQEVRPT